MRAKKLSGLLLLAPLLLSGCTPALPPSFHSVAATKRSSTSSQGLGSGNVAPAIQWVRGSRRRVLLTMQGGVSCPPTPAEIKVESPVTVILKMKTYKGVCTTDTGPQTSEFTLPSTVSRTRPVTFTMTTTDPEPSQKAVLPAPTA